MGPAKFASLLVLMLVCGGAGASSQTTPARSPAGGPVFSEDTRWVRPLIAGVALVFVAAGAVGPIVRARMAVEPPAPAPHDEPHVVSHH